MLLTINLFDLISIKRFSQDKQIVVWERDNRNKERFFTFFYNIGIEKVLFFSEEVCDLGEGIVNGTWVQEHIRDIFVWLTDIRGERFQVEKLQTLGLVFLEHFNFLEGAHFQNSLAAKMTIDPNIGYAGYGLDSNGLRKICVGCEKGDNSIVISGASLADSSFFIWKIWPSFFSEELIRRGARYNIYNGATFGYTSSQCYIKLIRDIIPTKPKLVIDYCALENDCFYGDVLKTPYIVGFQKKAAAKLKKRINEPFFPGHILDEVSWGNIETKNTIDTIVSNIRMARYTCQIHGIRYICVIPPSVSSQNSNSVDDLEMKWVLGSSLGTNSRMIGCIYDELKEEFGSDLIDARTWVDGRDGAFYDWCHMYEEGNQIVAKKLVEELYERRIIE